MYTAAIFDLDGTLLNTLDDLHLAVNFALNSFGFPERSVDEVRSFIGNGVVKLMQRSTPEGTDEKTDRECLGIFREHYLEHMKDHTAPYEGVIELLSLLKEKGIGTAVVSNKLHAAVQDLCDEFFPGLIDAAIGVSEESERKPSPVNAFRAIELLKSERAYTIYIGDSEVDVQTAKNAGLVCVGVTWGFRDEKELRQAGADFIVHKAQEIEEMLF